MNYRKKIGENIRYERMKRNISIEEFAEIMRLSSAFIGLIERGQRGAKLSNLIKIAEIFGITINDLVYGDSTSYISPGEESAVDNKRDTANILMSGLDSGDMDFVIASIRNLKLYKSGKE